MSTPTPGQPRNKAAKAKRNAREATVTQLTRLSEELVRISFDCPGIRGQQLPHTDHYIKLLFVPEEADYSWPFDLAEIKENYPRRLHPVTRTYTFRRVDTTAGTFEIDFVTHGATGLAGPGPSRPRSVTPSLSSVPVVPGTPNLTMSTLSWSVMNQPPRPSRPRSRTCPRGPVPPPMSRSPMRRPALRCRHRRG